MISKHFSSLVIFIAIAPLWAQQMRKDSTFTHSQEKGNIIIQKETKLKETNNHHKYNLPDSSSRKINYPLINTTNPNKPTVTMYREEKNNRDK